MICNIGIKMGGSTYDVIVSGDHPFQSQQCNLNFLIKISF